MVRSLFIGALAMLLCAPASTVFADPAHKPARPPDRDAALNLLKEELDALRAAEDKRAREVAELRKRIAALEEALMRSASDAQARTADALKDSRKELQAAREALDSTQGRLAALESRQEFQGRALPWLIPSLEVRLRPMYDRNRSDVDTGRGDSDLYYLQRIRLGVTLAPRKGVKGVLVLQDSREWGEEKSTAANSHSLDLYQGYLRFDDIGDSGFWVQAGRFAMTYGARRQVSEKNFNNIGQAFDGVRLGFKRDRVLAADAFAVLYRNGFAPVFQARGQDKYSAFAGLHLSTSALRWLDAELYGFYQDDAFAPQTEKVGTIGARLVARPAAGLELEGEAAVQVGKVTVHDETANLRKADHLATAYFLQAKYTGQVRTSPWIGLFFYSASGDANPYDRESVAYRPVFPSGKGNMGNLELFKWQGVWDIGPTVGLRPAKNMRISVDFHCYSLSTDGGSLLGFDSHVTRATDPYPGSLTGRVFNVPSGGSRFLGHEMDLEISFKPVDVLTLGLGYSYFKPGAAARRGQILSIAERTTTVDGAEVKTPYWKRDYRMGNDLAHRAWLEATLSL